MCFLSRGRSQSNLPPPGPSAFTEIATEKEELFLGSQTPEPPLRGGLRTWSCLNVPQGMEEARKSRTLGHRPPSAPGPGRKPRGRRCEGKEGAQGPGGGDTCGEGGPSPIARIWGLGV